MIKLEQIELGDFGGASTFPQIGKDEYESRLAAVVQRMNQHRLDFLVVYGDREHFANLAYLTGFDPRFEEALLLLDTQGRRLLLVGNEGHGYVDENGPPLEVELFQDFSLLGQPRDSSRPLRTILSGFGIGRAAKVGCVGWKYFVGKGVEGCDQAMEIPSYLVDLLRDLTTARSAVSNATHILMDPRDGLRVTNTAAQIAQFEYAATRVSQSVRSVIWHLREGVSERELACYLQDDGLPRSCHAMLSFGDKVRRGLSSPSDNVARRGDPFTVAFGLWGALTCRAGAIAAGREDLPRQSRDFYANLASNYFDVVACWYERVGVGSGAGQVFKAVNDRRDKTLFDFAVNPGHSIHLDEWVHSAFVPASKIPLRSGMALQMDIIPVSKGPFWYVNAEDGIALADEKLRARMAAEYLALGQRAGRAGTVRSQERLRVRPGELGHSLSGPPQRKVTLAYPLVRLLASCVSESTTQLVRAFGPGASLSLATTSR